MGDDEEEARRRRWFYNYENDDDDEMKYGNAAADCLLSEAVTQQHEGCGDDDECNMDYGDKSYDSGDLHYVRKEGKPMVAVLHIAQMFPSIKGDVLAAVTECFEDLECDLPALFKTPTTLTRSGTVGVTAGA